MNTRGEDATHRWLTGVGIALHGPLPRNACERHHRRPRSARFEGCCMSAQGQAWGQTRTPICRHSNLPLPHISMPPYMFLQHNLCSITAKFVNRRSLWISHRPRVSHGSLYSGILSLSPSLFSRTAPLLPHQGSPLCMHGPSLPARLPMAGMCLPSVNSQHPQALTHAHTNEPTKPKGTYQSHMMMIYELLGLRVGRRRRIPGRNRLLIIINNN